jgi:ABC-type Na+ efflux pump permease subunit
MPFSTRAPAFQIVTVAIAPLAAAALAASFAWDVAAMASGAPWRWVGWQPSPCPGCAACGLSRAFSAASHAQVREAIQFNAGVLALYPMAWLVVVAALAFVARFSFARR